jgi:thymidylate kinase
MLIVIEGPDKTGKTTLAKAIAEQLGYEYKHFSAPKGSPADEYIDFLLSLKRPTVCDRFISASSSTGLCFEARLVSRRWSS